MAEELLAIYDRERDLSDKAFRSACYAPFASLYFDQFGFVKACCQNTRHFLGNVANQSLGDIWRGRRASVLREALKNYDFRLGCQFCETQYREGKSYSYAREFDIWKVESDREFWPKQMEFSLSNVCNLECVMCNGDWSNRIRRHRENLPPLQKVYTDDFFRDLREFLLHVERVRMFGGEPFLSPETFAIWDILMELGRRDVECHITTNGTQYNERVERILNYFPCTIAVSMDAVTRETYEKIRVNAKYDVMMHNFAKFQDYLKGRGLRASLTFCLMTLNYHEFGEFLLFADQQECEVFVNTVFSPPHLSFLGCSEDELRRAVTHLDNQDASMTRQLTKNRAVWDNELARLRHRLQSFHTEVIPYVAGPLIEAIQREPTLNPLTEEARAREILQQWSGGGEIGQLHFDSHDKVVDGAADFLGVPLDDLRGRSLETVIGILRQSWGIVTEVHRKIEGDMVDRVLGFTSLDMTRRTMRFITLPRRDESGRFVGSTLWAAVIPKSFETAVRS